MTPAAASSSPSEAPCTPGPECDPAPTLSFPTYDNVGATGVGDCQFAAAADWEIVVLGRAPSTEVVLAAFDQATELHEELADYWPTHEIDRVRASLADAAPYTPEHLRELVRADRAVFAQLYLPAAGQFHLVIVDGFTPEGPLVVTWGATMQWTWAAWEAEHQWFAVATPL